MIPFLIATVRDNDDKTEYYEYMSIHEITFDYTHRGMHRRIHHTTANLRDPCAVSGVAGGRL